MENLEDIKSRVGKLANFIESILKNIETESRDNYGSLFHYTDLSGFKGIIENQCLWATNISYLNDPSEGVFVMNQFKNLHTLFKDMNFNKQLNDAIEKINNDCLTNLISFFHKIGRDSMFISCFSSGEEKLEMWNLYGRKQGICIEFDKELIDTVKLNGEIVQLKKVFYGSNYIENILRELFRKINNDSEMLKNACEEKDKIPLLVIVYILLSSRCKHECFSYEREYRLIADGIENNIKFRVTDRAIIPYIEISNKDRRFLIKSVTIGPSNNFKFVEQSVKYFLRTNGYNVDNENEKNFVKVNISTLPYRVV